MDIFVRQIPPQASEKQLKDFFQPYLADFNITTFQLVNFRNKPLANITILEACQGRAFLCKYGPGSRPVLKMHDNFVKCSVSRVPPSDMQLRTLEMEAKRQHNRQISDTEIHNKHQALNGSYGRETSTFNTDSIACGVWTYVENELTFQPHVIDDRPGQLIFGNRQAALLLDNNGINADRIDINHYNVDCVLTGDRKYPTVTFTLVCPPKFYRQKKEQPVHDIIAQIARLEVNDQTTLIQRTKKTDDKH